MHQLLLLLHRSACLVPAKNCRCGENVCHPTPSGKPMSSATAGVGASAALLVGFPVYRLKNTQSASLEYLLKVRDFLIRRNFAASLFFLRSEAKLSTDTRESSYAKRYRGMSTDCQWKIYCLERQKTGRMPANVRCTRTEIQVENSGLTCTAWIACKWGVRTNLDENPKT